METTDDIKKELENLDSAFEKLSMKLYHEQIAKIDEKFKSKLALPF